MPAPGFRSPHHWRQWFAVALALLAMAVCGPAILMRADEETVGDSHEPITIAADYSQEWTDDQPVAMLRGRCRVTQGNVSLTAQKMVLWHNEDNEGRDRLTIYLEDEAKIDQPESSLADPSNVVVLTTSAGIRNQVRRRIEEEGGAQDPLYGRALKRRSGERAELQQTQFLQPQPEVAGPELRSQPAMPTPANLRRVRVFPRSAVPYNVLSYQNAKTSPPEQIWVLTGGINLIVDGVQEFGTVDLAADRMVIWTQMNNTEEFNAESLQLRDTPFQVYLEGNVIIRQAQNVIKANRAVYDAREDRGLLLNAEVRTYVPELQGDLRVRADRVRQLSRKNFQARNAWVTGSQYGQPGYRVQAQELFLDYRTVQPWVGAGQPAVDPVTGMGGPREVPYVTSLDNTFYVEEFPFLYLPSVSGPAEDPNVPIRTLSVQQDRIFGTQVRATWDMFKLLGLNTPKDAQWDLYTDFLSRRGPGVGTGGKYRGRDLGNIPGRYIGDGLLYYINDHGLDNLGSDRRNLEPESDDRYRLQWHHRHDFPEQITVFGEIGLLSDRNFLEQYYENEFDRRKDVETLGYVKQTIDNFGWSALVRPDLNGFENTTEWLPRGDLFLLSEPLLNGRLTWSSHTSAGYARLRPATPPTDPTDLFTPLPFVSDSEGAVLMSRHELNAPFMVGPVNFVPFVGGEGAFWNEDFTGDSIDRFVGQAGLRSSVLFWRVFPYVRSDIFNLNGLAHKVRLEAEYAWTDSSRNLDDIPQYNEFDDNAQERFRQRLVVNTFGGALPNIFESRFYGVRSGAGSLVTSPYHELIDDQQVVRLALRQRLQTKVGPPERQRIKDWMTLDLEASLFPNPGRDNFGEEAGLLSARYQWNVGDRTSFFANALYDTFDGGQQLWNVGVTTQRSERGSLYLGLRQVKGQSLDSQIATASYSYRMSPKWISTIGTAFDLKEGRNIGQSLTITRIGSDFLVHLGANVDTSKGNAGFAISIEPRFGSSGGSGNAPNLSNLLGPAR